MSLRFIIGRCGSGKSSRVLSEIHEALQDGGTKLFLMVPEQYTLQAERDLIYELNLPGVINIEVLSFSRLAYKVFNEVGGLTKVHLNEQGKHMIFRRIIDKNKDRLSIYKTVSGQDGFIAKINDLITEFKKQDITPQMLFEKAEKLDDKRNILKMKLQDLAFIFQEYNDYLVNRYMDSEDSINSLIMQMDKADFLKGSTIWIDGFDYLTPQMARVLEKMIPIAKEVTITFTIDGNPYSYDRDIFKLHEISMAKVRNIASEHKINIELVNMSEVQKESGFKVPEILHIEKELYCYPCKEFKGNTENITVFSGNTIKSEVENMASQIIALLREKGWRYRHIAVVSGDMESYGSVIKRVFDEYDIPCFMDQKRPVINNPIIDLVLASIDVIDRGYRYQDVFKLLKTGFCGIPIEEIELLENYCLEMGIKGKRWLDSFIFGADTYDLTRLNDCRERFIEPLKKLDKGLKAKRNVSSKVRALYGYLEAISLQEGIESWIFSLREKGLYEYADENAQIWNILIETLDQLVEILGDQSISVGDFGRVLKAGFSNIEVGVIPTTLDQVLVGNIQRSKSQDIKALFVVGCNDGILPDSKPEDGLLADDERDLLNDVGIELSSNTVLRAARERFNIYTAFSKPSEYLWISYALSDNEGKAMRPSILIDRLKKLFKGIKVKSDLIADMEQQKHLIATPKSTFKYLIENIRLCADGYEPEDLWSHVYNWYYRQSEWDQHRKNMIDGLFHKNQEYTIGQENARKIYEDNRRLSKDTRMLSEASLIASVSRLEQYINCPFAHFIRYGLRPKERKVYMVAAPDIGELFHRSIEGFTKRLWEKGIDWRAIDEKQCDTIMDDVMAEIIPDHNYGILLSSKRHEYLAERLKRISKRAVWLLTDHIKRSRFNPIGHEINFGLNGTFPPIEVTLSDGQKVYLEGRIDRADIYKEGDNYYVDVIDFKSGYEDFSMSDAYYGLKLQLLVYLAALIENYRESVDGNVYPAGIFYFRIDDPLIDTTEKIADVITNEIRRKLKLKGLVLKDVNLVRSMDSEIDGWSEVLPVGIKKDGGFYSGSGVLAEDDFYILLQHVKQLIGKVSHEILSGNIQIEPVKKGNRTACTYCLYSGICQFDTKFDNNAFRPITKIDNSQVIRRIKEEQGGRDNDQVDKRTEDGN